MNEDNIQGICVLGAFEAGQLENINDLLRDAADESRRHLASQSKIPETLYEALLKAEISCRTTRGKVVPGVQIDSGAEPLLMPPDLDPLSFTRNCFTRF